MRLGCTIPADLAESEDAFARRLRGAGFFFRLFARRELAIGLGIFLTGQGLPFASAEDAISCGHKVPYPANQALDPEYGVGNWIWATGNP